MTDKDDKEDNDVVVVILEKVGDTQHIKSLGDTLHVVVVSHTLFWE